MFSRAGHSVSVVFLKNVEGQAKQGEERKVKAGFMRNNLYPKVDDIRILHVNYLVAHY